MTKRFKYDIAWAQGGLATDPDLDTTAPSYIPDRYKTIGWKAEKPPEAWQNFDTQISDLKIINLLQEGIPEWQDDISYPPLSITKEAGIIYRNNGVGPSTNKRPSTNPTVWLPTMSDSESDYNDSVGRIQTTLSDHVAADNPHNLDIVRIGGVTKSQFSTPLSDPNDSKTIVYHKNQMGKLHGLTPAQAGTLPTGGGAFAGDVTFLKKLIFRDTWFLQLNPATAKCELQMGTSSSSFGISIDVLGNAYARIAGVEYLIVTEATFVQTQNKVNPLFSIPEPYFAFNLQWNISDVNSRGAWTLDMPVDPVYLVPSGELFFRGVAMTSSNFGFATLTPITIYFAGRNKDGKEYRGVFDTGIAMINNFSNFLIQFVSPDTDYVKELKLFPRLTAYQKLQLVV